MIKTKTNLKSWLIEYDWLVLLTVVSFLFAVDPPTNPYVFMFLTGFFISFLVSIIFHLSKKDKSDNI